MNVFRCLCGFAADNQEKYRDHLEEVFARPDDIGNDGRVHLEAAEGSGVRTCACGFAASEAIELDDHLLMLFATPDGIGNDGQQHALADQSATHVAQVGPRMRGVRIPMPSGAEYELPHPIVARMALEVLWKELFANCVPGSLEPEEAAVEQNLYTLHEMLWRSEMEAVASTALTAHFLIIRPVNPLNMPAPEEAADIAAAIATLERHDLIARGWSDG
jgi:hypothetical protein